MIGPWRSFLNYWIPSVLLMLWLGPTCAGAGISTEFRVYWGDLHVHTTLSIDAKAYGCWNALGHRYAYEYALGKRDPQRQDQRDTFKPRGTVTNPVDPTAEQQLVARMVSEYPYSRLDFVGMADHSEAITDDVWNNYIRPLAAEYNRPGELVSFIGYEWSCTAERGGHKNVFFASDVVPSKLHDSVGFQEEGSEAALTADRLWAILDGYRASLGATYDAITIPHMTAYAATGGTDWSWSDAAWQHRYQILAEIYSKHGSSEAPPDTIPAPYSPLDPFKSGRSVQAALNYGFRLGLIGSTDTHNAKPGNVELEAGYDVWDYPQPALDKGGIVAVWSRSLDREGLWEALRARRTYASSGVRAELWVTMGGVPMGQPVTLPAGTRPRFAIHAAVPPAPHPHSAYRISGVEVVTGTPAGQIQEGSRSIPLAVPEPTPTLETEWEDPEYTGGARWYYVRVALQGPGQPVDPSLGRDERLWSSTFFVNYVADGPPARARR